MGSGCEGEEKGNVKGEGGGREEEAVVGDGEQSRDLSFKTLQYLSSFKCYDTSDETIPRG